MDHISDAISSILGIKVQPNDPGQVQISPKIPKTEQLVISQISPSDFILGTYVQLNKAHLMT